MQIDPGWPKEGDTLFQFTSDYDANAIVGSCHNTLARYAVAYKSAADVLVKSAVKGDVYLDLAVYPVVFLYRQYIELSLKDLIVTINRINCACAAFPNTHKLDVLWGVVRNGLVDVYGSEAPQEIDFLNDCLEELHRHDENSTAFRYPFDRDGKPYLEELAYVNLSHLMETMGRISSFLRCMDFDLTRMAERVREQQG